MQRFFLILFWSAAAFALGMAVFTPSFPVPGNLSDKVQHFLAFAVLSVLGTLAYPRARFMLLLFGLVLFGGLIELVQLIPFLGRDADWVDWAVDTGTVVVMLSAIAFARRINGWLRL